MSVIVRRATRPDLPKIVTLWRALQETNASYEPRLAMNREAADWFLDFLRDQLDNASAALFVAEAPGAEVVGYTFGQILRRPTLVAGDCGYVADVCVRTDQRGRGVGRELYHALRRWFADAGVTAIEVQVVRANPASQAFWRKMGFEDFLRTLRTEL